MYNIELYESIKKGDIQNSIYITTTILLTDKISIEVFIWWITAKSA